MGFEHGQHAVDGVIPVRDTFAVKAVAGLPICDLHHRQRGGQAALSSQDLYTVFQQLLAQLLSEAVGRERVYIAHRCSAQRRCASHVVRAASHEGAQCSIGLREAVHQRFAEYPNRCGHFFKSR